MAKSELRNLSYKSPEFWAQFHNVDLMKNIFYGDTKRTRETYYFMALALRYVNERSELCLGSLQDAQTLMLPDIVFETNAINEIRNIIWLDHKNKGIKVDSDWSSEILIYAQKIYNTTVYGFIQDKMLNVLEQSIKPDPLSHPSNGIDWLVKAESDIKKWFKINDCQSAEMLQFHHLLQNKILKTSTKVKHANDSNLLSDKVVLDDSELKFSSIQQSCMDFYAYESLRIDWCHCLDLGIQRDYLFKVKIEPDEKRITRYQSFTKDFSSLLKIGNIEPYGKNSEQDAVIYKVLSYCDRQIL
tara:strand:- start:8637 stop:9536 length:900 start_codon:yes stop_codon:yes gene_type:complete